ncbi:MAG: nitrogenase associated protein [Chloroflexi bacterium RBG_13_54_9]|nr:MAG: nitrogenase associated protein [Chloroflexi bacterium RBG_13_54_9]
MTIAREYLTATAEKCNDPYLRCALYGAAQTALGVTGCCVVSHAPQGCNMLVSSAFGWQDADYTETLTLCTKLCEDEIVHGGEELLTRTILEARELNVPIVFVLSSCGPEIVGDDIVAVCEDVRNQVDFEIVPIECAGFRGSQYDGTDIALDVILKKLVVGSGEKIAKSVCLIAPHANANPTWMGDLMWVKGVLAQMGVQITATITHRTALSDFEKVSASEASLVLSHDCGQKAADYLAAEFGVEQLCKDLPLPVGFTNTRRWLTELGERLGAKEVTNKLIAEGEKMVVEVCRRKGLEQFFMHRAPAAIVADATVGIPLVHFISEDLEMLPQLICLRSSQEAAKRTLEKELKELDLNPRVIYDADVYQSKIALAQLRPEIVFGSNIEKHAVEELDIPFVFLLVSPINRFRIIDREYFGYTGILNLIEYIQNDWRDKYRSKHKRYEARW